MYPSFVNLHALDSRFIVTYWIRYLSANTIMLGTLRRMEMFLDAACISITRETSWIVLRKLHRTSLRVNVPRAICALSSVSLTLLSIMTDENLIISRCLRLTGFCSFVSSKSVKLMHVLKGVRISWLTFAEYMVVSRSLVSRSRIKYITLISSKKKRVDSSPLKWICLIRMQYVMSLSIRQQVTVFWLAFASSMTPRKLTIRLMSYSLFSSSKGTS